MKNDWPSNIFVAIPSYRRSDVIGKKTLKFLERMLVPARNIHIFVREEEFSDYALALPPCYTAQLVTVDKPGGNYVRNFIHAYHPKGTWLVQMEDDVPDLFVRNPDVDMTTPRRDQGHPITSPEFAKLCDTAFLTCERMGLHLWGVYPTSNPMHMRRRWFAGLTFIYGAFYGMVVTRDPRYNSDLWWKEDFDRTMRHFQLDGGVLRYEGAGVVSTYMGGTGGNQTQNNAERQAKAYKEIDLMLARYPDVVREITRPSGRDIRLKRIPHCL